jgi:hypothetical protein
MPPTEVTATKDKKQVTVQYNYGADLAEAVKLYGEGVVFAHYKAKAVIVLQDLMRRKMAEGKTEEEVTAFAKEWKPGLRVSTKKTPQEKVLAQFAGLPKEEQAKLLAALRKSLGG